jgi:DNA-directed RNA polymerase subunit RPC12/RpoP
MTIQILGDLPKGVCITCGQETAIIKIFTFVEDYDEMKEVRWKYNCFKCDSIYRKITKYKKQITDLEEQILNQEFILFCRSR